MKTGRAQARRPEDARDRAASLFGLMAALGVERNILPSLKAPFRVPVGLAVAQENKTMAEHDAQNLRASGAPSP